DDSLLKLVANALVDSLRRLLGDEANVNLARQDELHRERSGLHAQRKARLTLLKNHPLNRLIQVRVIRHTLLCQYVTGSPVLGSTCTARSSHSSTMNGSLMLVTRRT